MLPMAERATQSITISAPPELCFAVVQDFERYPEWAHDVKDAVVVARDDAGRPSVVEFTAAAMGRTTRYRLGYDYAGAPARIAWHLEEGDIMTVIDGAYDFAPSASVAGGTDVTYELAIELVVPLPGFVKRRAELRILNTIKELKTRVEQVHAVG
jgi:hypothetical protein